MFFNIHVTRTYLCTAVRTYELIKYYELVFIGYIKPTLVEVVYEKFKRIRDDRDPYEVDTIE